MLILLSFIVIGSWSIIMKRISPGCGSRFEVSYSYNVFDSNNMLIIFVFEP